MRGWGEDMIDFSSKWLVETDWLGSHLDAPGLVVLDASLTMPGDAAQAFEAYKAAHIPGALFFDIEDLSDTTTALPHMLTSPEKFSSRMRKIGVGDGMKIVVYDNRGIFSAPRAWWMFRVMGHEDVAVLNGGLPKWLREGRASEAGIPGPRSERHFTARKNTEIVRDLDDMRAAVNGGRAQIADARSKARFEGREAELRPVARLGHMPGADSVPYAALISDNGTLKPATELRNVFAGAGINPARPVIATCGSGVTACILALGLAVLGNEHASVYDGSWAEWSGAEGTEVVPGTL